MKKTNKNNIKTVILCGGLGTRIFEETKTKPKPMIKLGDKPILHHIIEIYKKYGFKEFILATGYKGEVISKYFSKKFNDCSISVVNTGQQTMTGGRLLRLKRYFLNNENFMLTYGDGLTDQNLKNLLTYHLSHKKIGTITAVRPPARYGELKIVGKKVKQFDEKPIVTKSWINGGFFVFNSKIFNYLKNNSTILEKAPLEKISNEGELRAYKHYGFWQCMDTMRDKKYLSNMLKNKKAPWKK